MSERSEMIEWIRGELVGPSRLLADAAVIEFTNGEFVDPVALRRGPLAWRPEPEAALEEILYFERESPHRKYGAGLLHPGSAPATLTAPPPDEVAVHASDTIGAETDTDAVLAAGEDSDEIEAAEGP